MELFAITGKLYVVDGEVREGGDVPGLLAQPAPSNAVRGRGQDFLFVHLTLSGQVEETGALAHDLVDLVAELFYSTAGSVTAALRKAIVEANKRLLGFNMSGASKSREGAIVCAVQRGQELYMAQAGEAFALLGHNFGIERLPNSGARHITPLGRSAGLDIRFYHNWLQAGDTLLLPDPRLAHLPTSELESVLTEAEIPTGLEELAQLVGSGSARVILVEFTDEAVDLVTDFRSADAQPSSGRRLPPPTHGPRRESVSTGEAAQPSASAAGMPSVDVEVVETSARLATAKAARGLSGMTGWLADLLAKLRPFDQDQEDRAGWAMPALLAVVIPLIVAAVVTGVYVQRGRVVRVGEIKRAMRDNLALGRQAGAQTEVAAGYYTEVLRLADEGQQLRPGDNDMAQLRLEAMTALDGVSGIARLDSRTVASLDPGSVLTSIALGDELNGGIYFLDAAGNQAFYLETAEGYQVQAESEPTVVLSGEQVVGSHIVGQLFDLMWRPRGNAVTRDGLAMLDGRGALVSYYPNFGDSRAVPLGMAVDWIQPRAIASFNERLYVLDTGAQVIWRYFADGDGFTISEDQSTVDFAEDADLDQVVDFEIYSEDGSVILLYADGRLRRYASGRLLWGEGALADSGLELPLVAPVALKIVGRGLNSSIFVADPGSDRIIQLSLGGTFLAQYKAGDEMGRELFGRLRDFAVVENPLRIYVSTDGGVHVATQ